MAFQRQALLIAAYTLRSLLGSRITWAFALFTAATALFVVDSIVGPVEALDDAFGADAGVAIVGAVADSPHLLSLVTWVTDGDEVRARHLLFERPAILSGILLVLLMLTPLVTALGTFDQTAGDIASRWLRFVLIRSSRLGVFLGRLLAAAVMLSLLYLAISIAVTVYLDMRVGIYDSRSLYAWGLQGYLALVALALPYAALCAGVSAVNRSLLRALASCVLVVMVPIAALGFAGVHTELPAWLAHVHPWGWKYQLLDPEALVRGQAFLAMLVFTIVFGAAGALAFERSDV